MIVRPELPQDPPGIRSVHLEAFESAAEANLVDELRAVARPLVSWVAEEDGQILGHILFSPVSLTGHPELYLLGLAPLAVLPPFQRRGVGTALVPAGLEACRDLGVGAIVVLGHPTYYPRFGFRPAVGFGITCEYDSPPEAFMVLELQPGHLAAASGTIRYHDAFREF
jgi:putative acetyltransferase